VNNKNNSRPLFRPNLGFAMQQNWANYQFPGEYDVRIRVVPAE